MYKVMWQTVVKYRYIKIYKNYINFSAISLLNKMGKIIFKISLVVYLSTIISSTGSTEYSYEKPQSDDPYLSKGKIFFTIM